MNSLVTSDWLATAPGVRIVDATLLAADTGRDAAAEFAAGHIPGAVFLDLASLRDTGSSLPNMLPNADTVARRLGGLGIARDDRVVLYDASPWHSAARAWWLLRGYGMRHVAILDGGIAAWRAEGRPSETGTPAPSPVAFIATGTPNVRMLANMRRTPEQIVDARSTPRFTGEEPDPHAGTAPGHIPGSRSLPYTRLFGADGRWKRGDVLPAVFAHAGVDPARPLVATCGSGITAGVLAFGAHLLGHEAAIYDGSWSEWGADPSTPKAMGPA